MNNRKKLLLFFILCVLCLSVFGLTGYASEGNTTISFTLQDPEKVYMVGDTINVDVMLSNNPGSLSKVVVSVSYDKEVLEYVGINFRNSIFSTWSTKIWNLAPQQIWMSTNSVSQYSSENGLVCTLSFRALAKTEGTRVTPSSISMNSSKTSMSGYRYGSEAVTIPIAEYTATTIPVSGILLSKDSVMLVEGQSTNLTAAVIPDNATDPTVTWSSNNKAVAEVDQNGKITALTAGTAVISARAGSMTDKCTVTVQSSTPELRRGYIVDLDTEETNVAPGATIPVTVQVDAGTEDKNNLSYYNAVDMTIAYDKSKLTFLGLSGGSSDFQVTSLTSEGTVRLQRFGSKMTMGDAVTLNFQTAGNATGSAEIAFQSAYLDKSENASLDDAPPATMRSRVVTLQIGSESAIYRVTLPAGYEAGNGATATPSSDYTFSIKKAANYDYVVKATIGGQVYTLADKTGTGQYVLSAGKITGDIAITVEKTPCTYSVTVLGNGKEDVNLIGGDKAVYGTSYPFTVTHADGYQYTAVLTAGGTRISGVNPTVNGKVYTYTIPGDQITGTIAINVSKTSQSGTNNGNTNNGNTNNGNTNNGSTNNGTSNNGSTNGGTTGGGTTSGGSTSGGSTYTGNRYPVYGSGGSTYTSGSGSVQNGQQTITGNSGNTLNLVTISGDAKDLIEGPSTVKAGEDYTFTFKGDNKDDYVITATVDGEEVEIIDNGDGTYTIKEVKGNLQIIAEPTEKAAAMNAVEISVYRYIKLDGQDMYLITAVGTPGTGQIYTYDSNPMYYSEKYGAYCYLLISDQDASQIVAEAKNVVRAEDGRISMISYDGDVNSSKRVDSNDSKLVYEMYNAEFTEFTAEASMLRFLQADLSADPASAMCLDVSDVLAVNHPASFTRIPVSEETDGDEEN